MATCAYCNNTILFGGKKQGKLRFCSADCERKGVAQVVAQQIPDEDVKRVAARVHAGNCPNCQGPGPVDVHTSHRIYSLVAFSSWSSRPVVSCKKCGVWRKLGDTVFSLLFGWWGVPWGILVTPVQISKNLFGLMRVPDPSKPSAKLEEMVRLELAARALKAQSNGPAQDRT